jgi:hypothetical protein
MEQIWRRSLWQNCFEFSKTLGREFVKVKGKVIEREAKIQQRVKSKY